MTDHRELIEQAKQACDSAQDSQGIEKVRVEFLGKQGHITALLKGLKDIAPEDRKAYGQQVNSLKDTIEEMISEYKAKMAQKDIDNQLMSETIDVSLPGRVIETGGLHPITITMERICNLFASMGFWVEEGPEVETEYYNFEALNIPSHHPARAMHDTFYFSDGTLLRTHTSPVQIRAMEKRKPPLKVIAPGRVYRCDSDVTHTPMFHQVEGLLVDEHITFADLKGTLAAFLAAFFESEVKTRFRPSYFPFTEPSAEVDVSCVKCQGKGCRICKNTGWLEVLGCGMVHPKVLEYGQIDSEHYSGFAFGMGIERLAMLRYEVDDLRAFFENDSRILKQFNGA